MFPANQVLVSWGLRVILSDHHDGVDACLMWSCDIIYLWWRKGKECRSYLPMSSEQYYAWKYISWKLVIFFCLFVSCLLFISYLLFVYLFIICLFVYVCIYGEILLFSSGWKKWNQFYHYNISGCGDSQIQRT